MTAFCIPYLKSAFPLIFLFAVFFCVVPHNLQQRPYYLLRLQTNLLLLFVGEINKIKSKDEREKMPFYPFLVLSRTIRWIVGFDVISHLPHS